MAYLKPAQNADFNVVIHANNGESFTVATSSQETVADLQKCIASRLHTTDYRFDDRFTMLHNSQKLCSSDGIESVGIRDGSSITIAPKVVTGLKSSPATRQQIRKTVQSLVDHALEEGDLSQPRTLVAQVGNQNITVQLGPSPAQFKPAMAPLECVVLPPEKAEQLARRLLVEEQERQLEEQRRKKAAEADNKKLQAKLEALRQKMKRRREHSQSDRSSSSGSPAPRVDDESTCASPASPPVVGFAGLRKGFLLK